MTFAATAATVVLARPLGLVVVGLRSSGVVVVGQKRFAGGFPANMAVKKNPFVEAWNGKREITEKTFAVTRANVPLLLIFVMALPYGVYTLTRSEFKNRGDRQYKDLV